MAAMRSVLVGFVAAPFTAYTFVCSHCFAQTKFYDDEDNDDGEHAAFRTHQQCANRECGYWTLLPPRGRWVKWTGAPFASWAEWTKAERAAAAGSAAPLRDVRPRRHCQRGCYFPDASFHLDWSAAVDESRGAFHENIADCVWAESDDDTGKGYALALLKDGRWALFEATLAEDEEEDKEEEERDVPVTATVRVGDKEEMVGAMSDACYALYIAHTKLIA